MSNIYYQPRKSWFQQIIEIPHELREMRGQISRLEWKLGHMEEKVTAELTRVVAAVTALKTVAASENALLAQLADLIRANAEDPAALNALADDIDATKSEMTAAVVANTPSAPVVP